MSQAGDRGRGKRRATAVALAVLAHVAALTLLAWTTPALRLPSVDWPPDVTLELSPRTQHPPATASAAAPSHAAHAQPMSSAPERRREAPLPARPAQLTPPAPTAPPAPASRPAASQPTQGGSVGANASPASPGPAAQDRSGGDPRGAVRAAIGCSHEDFLRLTLAEREACMRQLAEQPRGAGPKLDPIDPLKRAQYDRQAAADARRRNHEGAMPETSVRCEYGSNFGTGCLPPGAMHSMRGGSTPRPPAPDVVQPETPAP